MVKYIKASSGPSINQVADKIESIWFGAIKTPYELHSTGDYLKFFKSEYGWDISSDEFNDAWDIAADPYQDGEDKFDWTEQEARDWLHDKLNKYGNTYFFPEKDLNTLNMLVEHFGNTYFWK